MIFYVGVPEFALYKWERKDCLLLSPWASWKEFDTVKVILQGIKKTTIKSEPRQSQYKHRIQTELVNTGTFPLKQRFPDINYLCYVFSLRWLFDDLGFFFIFFGYSHLINIFK